MKKKYRTVLLNLTNVFEINSSLSLISLSAHKKIHLTL